MSEYKFSVAISVYKDDDSKFFDRALESITVLQTVKPSEVVLVVDGLVSDEIDKVINKYIALTGIFNVIRLPENKGLGNALRIAVETASYSLIARMDSDDVSLPDRFEKELAILTADPTLDVIGGDITEFIDTEENIVAKRSVPCSDTEIKQYMKKRCPLNHVSVMFKKESVLACGNYQDLFWNEDYYLWIRMAEKGGKMANIGEVAVNVRAGSDMYKRRGGRKYFNSELFLQKYMLKRKMIGKTSFLFNVAKRLVIQILMPSFIRGWAYKKYARS
jgi:glycosyltransferase involved in cell wall biosynthesis